jgi:branched-chain amino acid transport system substrate-binding protein
MPEAAPVMRIVAMTETVDAARDRRRVPTAMLRAWCDASADTSSDTGLAIRLLIEQAGGKAGPYGVRFTAYEDATAASGGWGPAPCVANGHAHAASSEVAVMGTFNSGCARRELPSLAHAPGGPLLMVSNANVYRGLTLPQAPGEPGRYTLHGLRTYGRLLAPEDREAVAAADFAARRLHVHRCVVLDDDYLAGYFEPLLGHAFAREARRVGVRIVA